MCFYILNRGLFTMCFYILVGAVNNVFPYLLTSFSSLPSVPFKHIACKLTGRERLAHVDLWVADD